MKNRIDLKEDLNLTNIKLTNHNEFDFPSTRITWRDEYKNSPVIRMNEKDLAGEIEEAKTSFYRKSSFKLNKIENEREAELEVKNLDASEDSENNVKFPEFEDKEGFNEKREDFNMSFNGGDSFRLMSPPNEKDFSGRNQDLNVSFNDENSLGLGPDNEKNFGERNQEMNMSFNGGSDFKLFKTISEQELPINEQNSTEIKPIIEKE